MRVGGRSSPSPSTGQCTVSVLIIAELASYSGRDNWTIFEPRSFQLAFHHANRWTTAHAATVNVNVNVFSHLLSAAYKMTSGPLHVYLGILVRLHAKHSKPMIHNSQ